MRQGEEQWLAQPIGKQHSFEKGPESLNEVEQLKRQIKYLEIKNDIFKKSTRKSKGVGNRNSCLTCRVIKGFIYSIYDK